MSYEHQEFKHLKKGDKLIFKENSGIYYKKGNVVTFSNWKKLKFKHDPLYVYFQCNEMLENGFDVHSIPVYDLEIFNPMKHKEFQELTGEIIFKTRENFIRNYGA